MIEGARQGNADVLGQLLQTYWPYLWDLAKNELDQSIRAKEAASDVVQETFVDAQKSICDFRGETPAEFEAWLRAMLTHNVQDVRRQYIDCQKRSINRERPLDDPALLEQAIKDDSHSPSSAMQREELKLDVASSLARLPEPYQHILRYRYWEHRTFEEIGELLGKSPDAVRQMWYRAMKLFSRVAKNDHRE